MLKELLGITRLERRLNRIEAVIKRIESNVLEKLEDHEARIQKVEEHYRPNKETVKHDQKEILKLLKIQPMTTSELSNALKKHRTWVSQLINELEKQGKVIEKGRKGRNIVYALK